MESLQPEVAPFNIHTTIVNPGFFRTKLLTQESATYAAPSIAEYADRHAARRAVVRGHERSAGRRPRQARTRPRHNRSARSSHRAASSPAPMPSPLLSRR